MAVTKYLAKSMLGREELNYGVQLKTTWCDSRGGEDKCGMGRGLPIRCDWDPRQGVVRDPVRKKLLFGDEPSSLFVTCRHVVDWPYANKGRVGSKLQNITIRWGAGKRRAECDSGRNAFKVFVPKNSKLDLALIRIEGLNELRGDSLLPHLLSVSFTQLSKYVGLCCDLDWGAGVGFVSQQPWTGNLPILRTGVVASDPQTTFNAGPDVDRDEILLLEAQSFSGSSGSPVWAYPIGNPIHSSFSHSTYHLEQYRPPHLVGIMAGHIRNDRDDAGMLYQQHVGLSYCHKLEVLCKLLIGQEGLIEL